MTIRTAIACLVFQIIRQWPAAVSYCHVDMSALDRFSTSIKSAGPTSSLWSKSLSRRCRHVMAPPYSSPSFTPPTRDFCEVSVAVWCGVCWCFWKMDIGVWAGG
ncbi:hypothetical protein B0T21DRAFT_373475 [Apiosordaria backusii]|uniref:Secreted protein n=1 Tax=Apiosordaria backusii TaxID=314023 RepID=A0AA40ASX9_9PEZI|nr:hypothetical protein B0T21DRAFT_373475 [Apiosordaria backusii]